MIAELRGINKGKIMSIDTSLSRRQFSVLAAGSSLSSLIMPTTTALASGATRVLWTGTNFIQDSSSTGSADREIDRIFPNLSPHFKDKNKSAFLYEKMPGKWGALIGETRQHKIVWMDNDHTSPEEFNTNLAMILGITSDRTIAYQYYQEIDANFMVYEIQSYLLVVDVKAFEIMQSYPLRILSISHEDGKLSDEQMREAFKKKMWVSLSGDTTTGRTANDTIKHGDIKRVGKLSKLSGGKNLLKAPKVPDELQRMFTTLKFDNSKRARVRVTKVLTTKRAKNWINQEHPQSGETSVDDATRDADFKFLLGNSATTAISEHFGIGVQPHTPNVSLGLMVEDFALARGEDTQGEQKLLNTGKIDLDVRLTVKGIVFKSAKSKDAEDQLVKRCTILVELKAGRYKRLYDDSGQEEQSATLIGEPILQQNLLGLSMVRTLLDDFSNDWYWALDMHQRLFDWFFTAIAQGKDLSKLMKGQRNRGDDTEYVTRVYTKDLAKLEKQADAFRQALLTRR